VTAVDSACPGSVTAVCRLLAIRPLPPDSTIAPWKHLDVPSCLWRGLRPVRDGA
jgi:hypothetical protein